MPHPHATLLFAALAAGAVRADSEATILGPMSVPFPYAALGNQASAPLNTPGRSALLARCSNSTPTGVLKQSFTLSNPSGVTLNIVSAAGGNCDSADIVASTQTGIDDGAFGVTVSATSGTYTTQYERSSTNRVCLRVMCPGGNCGQSFVLNNYRCIRVTVSSSGASAGVTAGAVVGGVVLLVLVALACVCARRIQQQRQQQQMMMMNGGAPPVMMVPGAGYPAPAGPYGPKYAMGQCVTPQRVRAPSDLTHPSF